MRTNLEMKADLEREIKDKEALLAVMEELDVVRKQMSVLLNIIKFLSDEIGWIAPYAGGWRGSRGLYAITRATGMLKEALERGGSRERETKRALPEICSSEIN